MDPGWVFNYRGDRKIHVHVQVKLWGQMAFQTPFLFYEYKTEKLCFFKIDHARRQKNNGSRLFLKTTYVRHTVRE